MTQDRKRLRLEQAYSSSGVGDADFKDQKSTDEDITLEQYRQIQQISEPKL